VQLAQLTRVKSRLEPGVGGDYRIYEHERDDLRKLGRHSMEAKKEDAEEVDE